MPCTDEACDEVTEGKRTRGCKRGKPRSWVPSPQRDALPCAALLARLPWHFPQRSARRQKVHVTGALPFDMPLLPDILDLNALCLEDCLTLSADRERHRVTQEDRLAKRDLFSPSLVGTGSETRPCSMKGTCIPGKCQPYRHLLGHEYAHFSNYSQLCLKKGRQYSYSLVLNSTCSRAACRASRRARQGRTQLC